MTEDLLIADRECIKVWGQEACVRHVFHGLWIPVAIIRASGKACICYHPWYDDEGCTCDLPNPGV